MPWFLWSEFKDSGLCVRDCMLFFFYALAWPSLAPCEGRVEALCELFMSINYATTFLGKIQISTVRNLVVYSMGLLCVNDASGLVALTCFMHIINCRNTC